MMNGLKKSDRVIVATKAANKGGLPPAEQLEPRTLTKQNSCNGDTSRTQRRNSVSSSIARVRQAAVTRKDEQLTCLLHHITVEALRSSYMHLKKHAAPGVDKVTWQDYQTGLQQRLEDLHDRVHKGRYRACPSREVRIPKDDGTSRKLGIACLEDKIVQQAVVMMILNPIYENSSTFCGFSYGFRPGMGAHQALDALTVSIERYPTNWVIDADIRKFFDSVDQDKLVELLERRIGDKRVIRLIRKWLNAGVMVEGAVEHRERGTPQGAVISPILANIYLHYALDSWFKAWREHAGGRMSMVRYADDFVVTAQFKDDAEAFLADLKQRLAGYSLVLHSEKTRLLEFGKYAAKNSKRRGKKKPDTFNFLGMTHYCTTTRKGWFAVRRKPIRQRMNKTLARVKLRLRRMMHSSIKEQGRWLSSVLNGWLNYYAVPGSFRFVKVFRCRLVRMWYKTLRRRSQKSRISWEKMGDIAKSFLPKVTIRHPWPDIRFDERMQGRSPVR